MVDGYILWVAIEYPKNVLTPDEEQGLRELIEDNGAWFHTERPGQFAYICDSDMNSESGVSEHLDKVKNFLLKCEHLSQDEFEIWGDEYEGCEYSGYRYPREM